MSLAVTSCGRMCAMADATPQKSPQDAWNENQYLIECLVEETLRRMSGRGGFKKHYWVVLEEAKNKFLTTYREAWWLGWPTRNVLKEVSVVRRTIKVERR